MRYTNLTCGKYTFDLTKETLIMGILNVTPDSFSDGGSWNDVDRAVEHAKKLVADGAHIIDIGGESTRPGAAEVSEQEEIERVVPVIRAVREAVDVPISIDTYKAEVAKQAIEAGAHIINDIWGAKADKRMAEAAAHYDVPIILMHNRTDMNYCDFMADMIADLQESIQIAKQAGVQDSRIIIDPGLGFVKTVDQNLEAMRKLGQLQVLGYPVLLATSRKRFIGAALDLPVEDRVEGTGATTCLGIQQGCHIVRVHDVLENARMAKMMDAMLGKRGSIVG
jgi:dihydropteroate synthase